MQRMKSLLGASILASVVLAAGCATVGKDFATHNVDQIKIDKTTRADVQEMFGEPWRTGMEDGKRTWTYGKYRWSAFSDAETTDLVVRFNEDGTVDSYVYNSTGE
ncbi:outer membrane protein assembly factor BamE [Marinobacter sp. BGYM27]|uniref:outer membrane protein assembly factor BamE domain-containing protein n=1 Tax=unclassified Marinobacter TaxID=83889 RepID=UPI0021A77F9B|nr:outer membrane protein assembly factor BamE [Marinobacter sp. BGYM27]MDG5501221.1 outer membrane protein assembly factor BamE [Marinobacter sp. BGYM27]